MPYELEWVRWLVREPSMAAGVRYDARPGPCTVGRGPLTSMPSTSERRKNTPTDGRGAERVMIVTSKDVETVVAAARTHGMTPLVTSDLPNSADIGSATSIAIGSGYFSSLVRSDVVQNDIAIYLLNGTDPFTPLLGRWERFLKRLVDLVIAGSLLLVLSPFLVLVAVAIRLDSRGPIMHIQNRLGVDGRWFRIHKFRTMSTTNDSSQHAAYFARLAAGEAERHDGIYKIVDDPRITRVGRQLRRFSIDEIPQLFDALRGTMSLVGPRPILPREISTLNSWSWQRQRIKPGITGIWQVSGRSRTTFDEMIELDVQYARGWALLTDLRIILQTPAAIIRRETA